MAEVCQLCSVDATLQCHSHCSNEKCGESFVPRQKGQRFCTEKCRNAAREKTREQRPEHDNRLRPEHDNRLRPERYGPSPAIGVDGEGHERCYFLLAAASDDGFSDHVWNAEGLTTYQCFDFLLSLKDKTSGPDGHGYTAWGFSFKYDVNMMLQNVPTAALKHLHENSVVRWQQYRIEWFPGKKFYVAEYRREKNDEGKLRQCGKPLRSFVVWDMYPWQSRSFVSFLRDYKLAPENEIARIAEMKELRPDFDPSDRERITEYCINECRYLARGADKIAALVSDAGIRVSGYHSPAVVAKGLMRKNNVQDYMPANGHLPGFRKAFERAYFGGRAEVSQAGYVEGPLYQYDIRSAYPFAMTKVPCWRHGRWERVEDPATPLIPTALVELQWSEVTGLWGPFPWRPRVGSIKYPNGGTGIFWGAEVIAAQHLCNADIKQQHRFIRHCDHEPFGYLRDIYEERRTLKELHNQMEYVLKIGLNSSYGATAQRKKKTQRREPPWQDFGWAGFITGFTRSMIAALLDDDVVMVATDCVLSKRPLAVPVGSALGEWEAAQWDAAFIIGPGVYFLKRGEDWVVSKHRGYPALHIGVKECMEEWETNGRNGSLLFERKQFVGLGAALHRLGSVEVEGQWCKFIDTKVRRSFTLEPRREWCSDDPFDGHSKPPTIETVKQQSIDDQKRIIALRRLLAHKDLPLQQRLRMLHEYVNVMEHNDPFGDDAM